MLAQYEERQQRKLLWRRDIRLAREHEEAEHESGQRRHEQLAWPAPAGIGVGEIGLIRGPWLEVVAVLGTADAGRAVGVGHGNERRLPVDTLQRQQRTDGAAPTALALEQQATGDRGRQAPPRARSPIAAPLRSSPASRAPAIPTNSVTAIRYPRLRSHSGAVRPRLMPSTRGIWFDAASRTDVAPQSRCDERTGSEAAARSPGRRRTTRPQVAGTSRRSTRAARRY